MCIRLALAAALLAISLSPEAQPAPSDALSIDIPAGDLSAALDDLARQTGVDLVYLPKQVQGLKTAGVRGTLSAAQAIVKLLEGTPLQLSTDATGAMLIAVPPAVSSQGAGVAADPGSMRLTQAHSAAPSDPALSAADARNKVEEIVVTGSQIRGVQNHTVPMTVLDQAYIEASGVSTVTRLMETLPQNFAFNSQSAVPGVTGASDAAPQASSIMLRGLGEGTTLILLNGHRMAPGFRSATVDISALPLSAIERVEVLTDGASALYGSDAVGGVVNFILRKDFSGAQTELGRGWAKGLGESRLSQALGHAWDSGNALLSVEYYERDLLEARDRSFIPSASLIGSLLPADRNRSALFSGRQQLSPHIQMFADVLYAQARQQQSRRRHLAEYRPRHR